MQKPAQLSQTIINRQGQEEAAATIGVHSTFSNLPNKTTDLSPDAKSTLDFVEQTLFQNAKKRFEIKQVLGEGAAGIVWKATDNDIQRTVAIKKFKRTDGYARRACAHEIQFSGKLDHPGIPPVHDVGIDKNGHYFIVMKYAHGIPLDELIRKLEAADPETHQRYPFQRRAELMIQLLRILVSTHQKNILHRDIKPANILIGSAGELVLMDWGIAIDLNTHDGAGELCGTPSYMSPEQLKRQALDHRSDLYAVAAVFYRLLCLQPHFKAPKNLRELIDNVASQPPARVDLRHHESQGYCPSEYRHFIHKALSIDPNQRYQDANEMLRALERIQNGELSSICNRTTFKSLIHKYMKRLDKNPYVYVPLTYIAILTGWTIPFAIGLAIGVTFF